MLFMASGSVIHEVHHAHHHIHHDHHDGDEHSDVSEIPEALVSLVKHLRTDGLTLRQFFDNLDISSMPPNQQIFS